jgi:hypothetical protein
MPNMKRIPASESRKATEQMRSARKVKITGTASSKPQVSGSMSKSQPKPTKPKGSGISRTVSRAPSGRVNKPLPRDPNAAPSPRRLLPKGPNTAPSEKRLLAKATKRAPLETKRIGGVFAVPKKPKKTIY